MATPARNPPALAAAFAGAARRYWLSVFPCVCREFGHWRLRAREIPDPALRRLAFAAQLTKRESLEGAVALATFAPYATRTVVVRAITAYQMAFDYIDVISEQQSSTDPIVNGRHLNQALLTALEPGVSHPDYYAHHPWHDDGGYLENLIDTCRAAIAELPSFATVAELVRRATTRIIAYQSLNHGDANGSHDAFAHWALAQTALSTGLRWWETGAAAGSPLTVFALIATAAKPTVRADDAAALESAYFPWIASLSTLLDSLIDQQEDTADGQRSLIDYYASPQETAARLRMIATHALRRARVLPDADHHTMILAAMASFYHSTPQASSPDIRLATQQILNTMGDLAAPTMLILKARRGATRLGISRSGAYTPSIS
jgi:tetraprenyl-beta-curcumene synthase